MKLFFQKNVQFGDIWPRNCQKIAQIEVVGHFLDFASFVFLNFAHNDRWTWCLVVFLQFTGPVNVFLLLVQKFVLSSITLFKRTCQEIILRLFLGNIGRILVVVVVKIPGTIFLFHWCYKDLHNCLGTLS